jgi:hypothetical protein
VNSDALSPQLLIFTGLAETDFTYLSQYFVIIANVKTQASLWITTKETSATPRIAEKGSHSEGLTAYLTAMGRFHNYCFGTFSKSHDRIQWRPASLYSREQWPR